jgi:5-methyltetrahydropteroyltriglutamate--homocysteine methyltransferase
MRRSTNRILVSHAGTTPRPAGQQPLSEAVKEVVDKQVEVGIDIVNDGELSKSNFTNYVRERLGGIAPAGTQTGQLRPRNINARDLREFPEFFASGGGGFGRNRPGAQPIAGFPAPMIVSGPITYVGEQTAQTDAANLKAAIQGLDVEAFLPAVAPGTVEHWLYNQY